MWSPLSDERTGLPFTIADGSRQRVILESEFRGTHDHILLSQIRDSPNLEGQVPVFISPTNRMAQLYPQALGSLTALALISLYSLRMDHMGNIPSSNYLCCVVIRYCGNVFIVPCLATYVLLGLLFRLLSVMSQYILFLFQFQCIHDIYVYTVHVSNVTSYCNIYIVAYLRHARTVASKHVPAITQQLTKRCFLVPSRALPCVDESRIASHRLASPSPVCCQATAINTWKTQEYGRGTWPRQQWCNNWSFFSHVRSRVYRRDWS
jgi:hypothetical protein